MFEQFCIIIDETIFNMLQETMIFGKKVGKLPKNEHLRTKNT